MAAIKAEIAGKLLTLLGYDGADFYNLKVDAAGHLQVDCLSSALPAGAATAAKQDTEIATLELIALIRNALQTVDTDRLIVRAEDQLFSYAGQLSEWIGTNTATAPNHTLSSSACPAGEVWVVTGLSAYDKDSACTRVSLKADIGGDDQVIWSLSAVGAYQIVCWSGHVYLAESDSLNATFIGVTAGDDLRFHVLGYKMTLET